MQFPSPLKIPKAYDSPSSLPLKIPEAYLCPITSCLMSQPTISPASGGTYEYSAILKWIKENGNDPIHRDTRVDPNFLIPNLALRSMIESYIKENVSLIKDFDEGDIREDTKPSRILIPVTPEANSNIGGSFLPSIGGSPSAALVRVRPQTNNQHNPSPRTPPPWPLTITSQQFKSRTDASNRLYILGQTHLANRCSCGRCACSCGKYFQFNKNELTEIIGRWNDIGKFEDNPCLKDGKGCVLLAKNERSGKEGGLLFMGSDDRFGGYGCWNPYEFASPGDFQIGDPITIKYFGPTRYQNLKPISITAIDKTGWNLTGENIVFGACGLVGDHWGRLTVAYEFEEKTRIVGVKTDSGDSLPFNVSFFDEYGGEAITSYSYQGGSGEVIFKDSYDMPNGAPVCKIVVVGWEGTDLHKLGGLSSARSGGGIHCELLGLIEGLEPIEPRRSTGRATAAVGKFFRGVKK